MVKLELIKLIAFSTFDRVILPGIFHNSKLNYT